MFINNIKTNIDLTMYVIRQLFLCLCILLYNPSKNKPLLCQYSGTVAPAYRPIYIGTCKSDLDKSAAVIFKWYSD